MKALIQTDLGSTEVTLHPALPLATALNRLSRTLKQRGFQAASVTWAGRVYEWDGRSLRPQTSTDPLID